MEQAIRKAEVLIEALSYIRTFRDKLTVIKLGGSAMEDPDALAATLQDIVFMETVGMRPIVVHGGGKAIDRAMVEAGLKPRKVQGRRYTDDETLTIVVATLLKLNDELGAQIRQLGGRAVGLHSGSLQTLYGEKLVLPPSNPPLQKGGDGGGSEPIDLGRVGNVNWVDTTLIESFCSADVVPIIPSLAFDDQNRWLNVNADTAAAAVAGHLKAAKFVLLTDTSGILRDRKDESSAFSNVNAAGIKELVAGGVIDSGMLPKVEACLDSLRAGVKQTHVVDGRLRHSLLLEIYTRTGVGTEISLE